MSSVSQILTSVEFWKIAFPAGAAILAWYLNEREKLVWEQYKKKEENYKDLLRSSRGFLVKSSDDNKTLREDFLEQVNLSWLYASDDVIRKAYDFLGSVHQGSVKTSEQREDLLRVLVHAIRQDLLARKPVKKTNLEPKNFQHLKVK
jgi:hypothetical protein